MVNTVGGPVGWGGFNAGQGMMVYIVGYCGCILDFGSWVGLQWKLHFDMRLCVRAKVPDVTMLKVSTRGSLLCLPVLRLNVRPCSVLHPII